MIALPKFKKEYFYKFSTKPVTIKPCDPKSKVVAEKYIKKLTKLLNCFDLEIIHRGSTAFRISGKGDVELGVYPTKDLLANPEILKKYEQLKKKYSFSKREYQIQKDRFLREVVSQIPDD